MQDYIRARTEEQKEERLGQIKDATDSLFKEMPYTAITLTTIADKLGWSRANLYKYVTTKEEIFLELVSEKMTDYFNSMLSAFPEGNNFSTEVIAEVWAGILNAHKDYLRYVAYLMTIIETNVTVERLAGFKKKWYGYADELSKRLSVMLGIEESAASKLIVDIQMYASQLVTDCLSNPLILQALKLIEREVKKTDFCESIKDYTKMCINWCVSRKK